MSKLLPSQQTHVTLRHGSDRFANLVDDSHTRLAKNITCQPALDPVRPTGCLARLTSMPGCNLDDNVLLLRDIRHRHVD